MPDPYRTTYGVAHRVRPLSAEEAADIRVRRETWVARAFPEPPRLLLLVPLVALAVIGLAVWRGAIGLAIGVGTPLVFMSIGFAVGERRRRLELSRARGPWHAPEGGWSIRETEIVARSIAGAGSDDEDYVSWALFEIPGGEWLFLDLLILPEGSERDLARERVTITQLWPDGQTLAVRAEGAPIPLHGTLATDGNSYAAMLERGHAWRPPSEYDEPRPDDAQLARARENRVAESQLPPWIRALTERD